MKGAGVRRVYEASIGGMLDVVKIIQYNKTLKPFARQLRKEMTDCEVRLWHKIRRKQIQSVQFFRQKPLGSFILDFYSKDPKLAIELDGGQHFSEENKKKDKNRDAYLRTLGIFTLRFTNLEVLQNCDGVLFQIEQTILKLTSPRCSPRALGEHRPPS